MKGSSTNSINSIYFTKEDLETYILNGDIRRITEQVNFSISDNAICTNLINFFNSVMKSSLECSGKGELSFACSLKDTTLSAYAQAFSKISGIATVLFNQKEMNYLTSYTSPTGCIISWKLDNPYLNPKPIMPALPALPKNTSMYQEDHWKLFKEQLMTDVTFVINGEEIKAHKVFLLVSPVFRNMFTNGMKESSSTASIPLESISSREVFEQLMKHFYCGQVDVEFLKDPHHSIELLAIAHEYQLDKLVKQCAKHLEGEIHLPINEKSMDPELFLAIANSACAIEHQELIKLCQWYLTVTPAFHQTVDLLKDKTTEEVLQLIHTAKRLKSESLEQECYDHLKANCISLDSFVRIAQYTIQNKNKSLKNISKKFVKNNYDEIFSKKEGVYKKHWELYSTMMLVPRKHSDYKLTFDDSTNGEQSPKESKDKEKIDG